MERIKYQIKIGAGSLEPGVFKAVEHRAKYSWYIG